MIAAIYARKSTDDSDRPDEARSTARQIARATEYATVKGWTVDPRYIFVDDAVSGAEWKHRPGFNALLAALEPRPPFGVLIVSELSRIGRDTVRTPAAVLQIEEAGVAIHGYLSGAPITLGDETGEMTTMLHSLGASFERRRARARTYDALRRRAEAGAVTGGRLYGYANARNGNGYVHRVIVENEAAIVRRVFEMYAEGAGIVTIAHTLNTEGVRPPRARGWAPSGIREMLHRRTYVGEVEWGKLQKVTRRGTKHQRHRPESEWLTVSVPACRSSRRISGNASTCAWPSARLRCRWWAAVVSRGSPRSRATCSWAWPGVQRAARRSVRSYAPTAAPAGGAGCRTTRVLGIADKARRCARTRSGSVRISSTARYSAPSPTRSRRPSWPLPSTRPWRCSPATRPSATAGAPRLSAS
jgi:DNA invertase Pin-like site-specific DNA recombinase